MTHEEYAAAARYWTDKDAQSVKMDPADLKQAVEAYILAHNTCALATGSGSYVRCTPIEYSYHDGCFWMFTEGGRKFIGLEQNPHVCLAIFDNYREGGALHGMQVMGLAEVVEPFSDRYNAHAAVKQIPLDYLRRMDPPMHLLCVRPETVEFLSSDFRARGCANRQTWQPE